MAPIRRWRRPSRTCPVNDVILDGEAVGGWERFGRADYYVFDILWLDGRDVTALPLDERRALLRESAAATAARARGRARRSRTLGARVRRRVGRRHRQAPRLEVRASPLEELAEDEVRGEARVRRRRLHRSAGQARRPRRAPRRLLRRGRLLLRRKDRHRLRHGAAARSARAPRRARDSEDAVHESQGPAAPARALGASRDRRRGGLHRVDRARQAPASAVARRAHRSRRAHGPPPGLWREFAGARRRERS